MALNPTVPADVQDVDAAAAAIHEEWRRERLAAMGARHAAWKRVEAAEFEEWAEAAGAAFESIHRYCPPRPDNRSAPVDADEVRVGQPRQCSKCKNKLMPDAVFCRKCGSEQKEGAVQTQPCIKCASQLLPDALFCRKCGAPTELGENAVHWCDIDQPFALLSPSWKEANRKYVPHEEGELVHWVDIDQPYHTLPERWKAENRQYAVPAEESDVDAATQPTTNGLGRMLFSVGESVRGAILPKLTPPDYMKKEDETPMCDDEEAKLVRICSSHVLFSRHSATQRDALMPKLQRMMLQAY